MLFRLMSSNALSDYFNSSFFDTDGLFLLPKTPFKNFFIFNLIYKL